MPAPPLLPGPNVVAPFPPPDGGGGPPGPPGPTPPVGVPVVEVTASGVLGTSGLGAAAGVGDGSCTAIAFEPSADGCITHPRQDAGVRAEASGQALPQPIVISLP